MSNELNTALDEIIANAKELGALNERIRIEEAARELGIPFIPLATLRRLLNEVKDDEAV